VRAVLESDRRSNLFDAQKGRLKKLPRSFYPNFLQVLSGRHFKFNFEEIGPPRTGKADRICHFGYMYVTVNIFLDEVNRSSRLGTHGSGFLETITLVEYYTRKSNR
jgi:hypothetical protein